MTTSSARRTAGTRSAEPSRPTKASHASVRAAKISPCAASTTNDVPNCGSRLVKKTGIFVLHGLAKFVGWFAGVIRFLQSGYIYHYAFAMIIGMLGLLTLFVTLGGK